MSIIRKMSMVAYCIIMSATVLAGCGNKEQAKEAAVEQTPAVRVSVETQEVKPSSIEEYKEVSSKVSAESEIAIMPKVTGIVSKVNVKVGDKVKKGDILFEIDPKDINLQVETARASVVTANASVVAAQAGLDSARAAKELSTGSSVDTQIATQKSSLANLQIQYEDLAEQVASYEIIYETGGVSKKELDNMKSQLSTLENQLKLAKDNLDILQQKTVQEKEQSAQASIKQAEAGVNQAKAGVSQAEVALQNAMNQLTYTKVKAEVDGIVSQCPVSVGAMISPQSPALTLVDIDTVKIKFDVADDIINKVSVGDKVYTTVDSLPDKKFEGVVASIAPAANSQTMLYPIEVYIKNTDHLLKPGMFATSKLVLDKKGNIITIPLNAVIEKGGEKYVYIVDEKDRAHKIAVEVGIEGEKEIEIISGLNPKDQVVVRGQDYIKDGSEVNIVDAAEDKTEGKD